MTTADSPAAAAPPHAQANEAQANEAQPAAVARRYPPTPLVGVAVAVFRPVGAPDIPIPADFANRAAQAAEAESTPPAAPLDGEVLLVQRKNPPRAREWGLPGGRLHLGERLAEGVQRELWEECAIAAHLGGIFDAFEPIVYDTEGRIEYHYVVIEYWAGYRYGIARAADDAAALAWIPMDTLENYNLQADSQLLIRRAYGAWQDWTTYGKRYGKSD